LEFCAGTDDVLALGIRAKLDQRLVGKHHRDWHRTVAIATTAAAASMQTCEGKKEHAEKSHSHCREACDCELRLSFARL